MSMIEVKTAELIGPALDWAVAKAIGASRGKYEFAVGGAPWGSWIFPDGAPFKAICGKFSPSTDWSQGGPLFEKYGIGVAKFFEPIDGPVMVGMEWAAIWIDDSVRMDGPTALVAACRVIVAAKLGDTVPVPAELLETKK